MALLMNFFYLNLSGDTLELPSSWMSVKVCLRLFAWVVLACAMTTIGFGQEKTVPVSAAVTQPSGAPVEAGVSQNTTSTPANYLLRSDDLIRITVFQEDDLTTEVRIPESGSIMFPLLGAVQVKGKSVADAQELIRSLLAKKYIINPHVNVAVLDYAKQWVTVLGEVHKPGNVEVPLDSGLDLLGAIALSGGFSDNADASHVNIRRMVNGQEVILYVNATALSRSPDAKPCMVLPGDAITVPYVKKWLTVLGEVKNPGKVNLPTEGELDLLGAIALAGGFAPDADIAHISVRRAVNGKDVILSVNAKELTRNSNVKPFLVQPDDSITVPERMF